MYSRREAITTLGFSGAFFSFSKSDGEIAANEFDFRHFPSLKAMEDDKSLKEGSFVSTAGYFSAGDGGGGQYLVKRATPESEPDGGSYILLHSGLAAHLVNVHSVNYKMFGAVCDGINDDGVQIKAAHAYANACRLPVINLSGEYWLKQTNSITIQESTQWGSSIFHIDEQYNTQREHRFLVISHTPRVAISLDGEAKKSLLEQIKPGVSVVPLLAPYKNCLVFIADTNDRIGFRAGEEYQNRQSWAREEFFYVEEHGRIVGDIAWTFSDYTELTAYCAETCYLTIDGGTFYLSGDNPGVVYRGYWNNGFQIQRSRTIIRNQWVGLEKERTDLSLNPRRGFYSFSLAYDVILENVRLLPWEIIRDGQRVVPQGTYGISVIRTLNSTFRNVTAEGSSAHWGVFGSNLNKNFRIEQCMLNRVDVHFHCWNLHIIDTQIGFNGITITGGGDLLIENTTVSSTRFVNFRRDYGSRGDGHIRIRNCRHKLIAARSAIVLDYNPDLNYDYKYPIGYGRTIRVENMVIDASAVPNSEEPIWLMSVPQFDDGSQSVFFPYDCVFKDIWVEGRLKGARLMRLPDFSKLYTLSTTNAQPADNKLNVRMLFSNIILEKPDEATLKADRAFHLQIAPRSEASGDVFFRPEIQIEECNDFVGDFADQQADIDFNKCILSKIIVGKDGLKGKLNFKFCRFMPVGYEHADTAFSLDAEDGVNFLCCQIHAPANEGIVNHEWLYQLGFIEINKSLRFNHLHTRLGADIINLLKKQNIELSKDFLTKLQNNYEL